MRKQKSLKNRSPLETPDWTALSLPCMGQIIQYRYITLPMTSIALWMWGLIAKWPSAKWFECQLWPSAKYDKQYFRQGASAPNVARLLFFNPVYNSVTNFFQKYYLVKLVLDRTITLCETLFTYSDPVGHFVSHWQLFWILQTMWQCSSEWVTQHRKDNVFIIV